MLAYAYFAIAVPVGIVALLVYSVPRGGWGAALRRTAPDALLLAGLAVLPMLAWVGFVIARNGAFFSFEVACCRQIVWMGDAWAAGGAGELLRQLGGKLLFFGRNGLMASVIPLLVMVLVGLLGWSGRQAWRLNERDRLLLGSLVCVSGVSVLFFSLLGYTVPRLATGSMVPLVVGAGLLAREAARGLRQQGSRRLNVGLLLGIVAIVAFVLAKPGPFS